MHGLTFQLREFWERIQKFDALGVPVLRLIRYLIEASKTPTEDHCWIWPYNRKDNGYGLIYSTFHWRNGPKYGQAYAHRLVYQLFYGSIHNGKEINHLCGNTLCVNPRHLQAATRRENVLHGNTIPARNEQKTHCPSGHEYNSVNTHYNHAGNRQCRVCGRLRAREKRARLAVQINI